MGFLDSLKGTLKRELDKTVKDAQTVLQKKAKEASIRRWNVTFDTLPKNLDELKALPEASLKEPYYAVALAVAAYNLWEENCEEAKKMLQFIAGPRELTPRTWNFVRDRFMDGKGYFARSYFHGTSPENDYTPSMPYTLTVYDNPNGHTDPNYFGMMLQSSGADGRRPVTVRLKASTGQWFLWEDSGILMDIRIPKGMDKWA